MGSKSPRLLRRMLPGFGATTTRHLSSNTKLRLPADWQIVSLGDVIVEAESGFASGERDNNGVRQLRMNNLGTNGYIVDEPVIRVPKPRDVGRYWLQTGDILVNNTNSVDLIGKTVLYRGELGECVYSNHITRLRVDQNQTTPEWVLYNLMYWWSRGVFASLCARHVGQAGVSKGDILGIELVLPPLPEQRKIAAILSTVDENIRKTQQIIKKAEELKRGLMQQLLARGIGQTRFKQTEIGEIPEEWEVTRIVDIAQQFISGGTPETSVAEYWDGDIPWITGVFVTERVVYQGERYITRQGLEHSATHIVPKGGLLLVTRTNVGNIALAGTDIAISQDLTGIVLNKIKTEPDFIVWYLLQNVQNLIRLQQGTTIQGIIREDVEKVLVALPSLAEQKQIVGILSTVDEKTSRERRYKANLEQLKKGLIQTLLTGRVRVKVDKVEAKA